MSLIELQSAEISVVRLTLRVWRMRSSSAVILLASQQRSLNHVSMYSLGTCVHSGCSATIARMPSAVAFAMPAAPSAMKSSTQSSSAAKCEKWMPASPGS